MNPWGENPQTKVLWGTANVTKVTAMAFLGGLLLTSACAPSVGESESDTSKGTAVAGVDVPVTGQLTADQNRAKAMEAIDSNTTMTPEQKAAAKKQLESMSAKR